MKKILLGITILICVFLCNSYKAEACDYTPWCAETREIYTCGVRYGVPQCTHQYVGANGNIYLCGVTNETSIHTAICMGCRVKCPDEERVCNELHSACGASKYGICQ